MGCLKGVITSIVLVLAFIGFMSIGGGDLIMNGLNYYVNPSKEQIEAKAQTVADFKSLPSEYKVEHAIDMLGIKGVVSSHIESNQKMAVVDPGWALSLTKEDIQSEVIEDKLTDIASKINYPNMKLKSLIIQKKDILQAFEQEIPYVKVKADIDGIKDGKIEAVIGVMDTENGEHRIVVSGHKAGEFSQQVAEAFFKSLKLD